MSMLPALINEGGKALTKAANKTATSELSRLIGNEVIGATTKGLAGATTKKIASSLLGNATDLGLAKNGNGKWVLNTRILDTDDGVSRVKDFMRPILGGENTTNYKRLLEQIGEGEYQMGHRPNLYVGDSEVKFPLSNMEADPDYLPQIYGENREKTIRNLLGLGNSGPEARKSAEIIADYRNQPDKLVKIFRQSPKDMNYGDWIGLNEEYANMHIGNHPDNKLWSREVPASEVLFAGDDINEWGYYPKEVQLDDDISNELSRVLANKNSLSISQSPSVSSEIPVITSSNPMTLQSAYDKLISLKKATLNNAQKNMSVFESGLKPNIQVSDDFLNADKGSYLKSLQDNYDLALKNDLGEENALELKRAIEPFTSIGGNYEEAKKRAMDYIASGKSNKVTENSSKLLGDKNIFRSKNSDNGISWTLDPSVAKEYAYNVDNPVFQIARTGGDAVLIAPQYTERYQPSAMIHNEAIGYPYNIKNIDSVGNGNFDYKGNGRGWFADNENNPHISKLLKDTGADKYLGQPKNPVNMSVYDGYRSGYGGFANDVKSIGNSNVAPIDKSTLPENYEFFSDLTKKNKAKYGWVYDAVSKETGKPASRITNADLKKYLEDYYPDYVSDGKMTKYDLEKSINDAMEDEMTDLGYENSADLSVVVHNRPGNAGIRDLYNDHSGRTGRIDRELSKRLGIGESTSVMADKLLRAGYGDAAGDATGNMMGIDYGSWYGDNDETNLGTVAHERMHLMQDAANGFDYEQVQPAYNELHDELQKAMLNEDELRKAHSNFDRKGMGYWGNYKEQEARMLEAYLYDEGYTKARPIREEEFRDKMDIIKPAFDKFFNKLRELSKKGVALPAVAIASLFGLNKENDEESVDNIQ